MKRAQNTAKDELPPISLQQFPDEGECDELPFPTGEEEEEEVSNLIVDDLEEERAVSAPHEAPKTDRHMKVKRKSELTLNSQRVASGPDCLQVCQYLANSGSSRDLLSSTNAQGVKKNRLFLGNASKTGGTKRHTQVSEATVTLAAGFMENSGSKQVSITQAQQSQAAQTVNKPSLKLLLAQQTTKPDPSTRNSPPITSNCQSQSSILTTQTKQSPLSSVSTATAGQKARNIQNSIGAHLLQSATGMFLKSQPVVQTAAPSTSSKGNRSAPQQQLPKPRKSAVTYNAKTSLPAIVKQTTSAPVSGQQSVSAAGQQPKVGKQLTEMLDEARPSMTGDIDDVANLVTPSPRRNPGKLQSSQQQPNVEGNEAACTVFLNNLADVKFTNEKNPEPQLQLYESFEDSQIYNEFNHTMTSPQLLDAQEDEPKAKGHVGQHHSKQIQIQTNSVKNATARTTVVTIHAQNSSRHSQVQAQAGVAPSRQLPLQSSIETKKACGKHPYTKAPASKPFQSVRANNPRSYELNANGLNRTPKLFLAKPQKQKTGTGATKEKDMSLLNKQQSCDIMGSSDTTLSDLERTMQVRQSQGTTQKSALAVFGHSNQSPTVEIEVGSGVEVELSKSCHAAATSKRLVKAMPHPKQIEIELGFDQRLVGAVSKLKQPRGDQRTLLGPTAEFNQTLVAKSEVQAQTAHAGSNSEIPLEERIPNQAFQVSQGTKASVDLSLKNKCRQKVLNQTMVEKQVKISSGTKAQAIPTLNLHSFKSRPQAPVTSRNMSNAASLVKKQQLLPQVRNPNFGKRVVAKEIAHEGAHQILRVDISPPIPTLKTMESISTPGNSKSKAQLTLTAKANSVTQTNVVALAVPVQSKKPKGTISSSVDARRVFSCAAQSSLASEELGILDGRTSQASRVQQNHQSKCVDSFTRFGVNQISKLQKIEDVRWQHANISIDLSTQNQNEPTGGNPQFKTESLERILGSQAESYFRQIERTMQMGPVNVSQSQNRSQRPASLSQTSCLSSAKAGYAGQEGAVFGVAQNQKDGAQRGNSSTVKSRPGQKSQTMLIVESRVAASADKKSSCQITKIKMPHSSSVTKSLQGRNEQASRQSSGGFNRDRFVVHRRIDLICDDTVESAHSTAKATPSATMLKDGPKARAKISRKKSDSISSESGSFQVAKKVSSSSFGAITLQVNKPGSSSQRNQLASATRNSKSSFVSKQGTSNSTKQSVTKDWVMCLPNEPPQVIEQVPILLEIVPDSILKDQSSSKKDNSLARTELSGHSRGGKSLLHQSAQKKVKARLMQSKESVNDRQALQQNAQFGNIRNLANNKKLPQVSSSNEVVKLNKLAQRGSPQKHHSKLEVKALLSSLVEPNGSSHRVSQSPPRSTCELKIAAQTCQFERTPEQAIKLELHNPDSNVQHDDHLKSRRSLVANISNKDQKSSSRRSQRELQGQAEPFVHANFNQRAENKHKQTAVIQRDSAQKMRQSIQSASCLSRTEKSNTEAQFSNTDDEAAQYYDKLTSLFQETRAKLKEFNKDFKKRTVKPDKQRLKIDLNQHDAEDPAVNSRVLHGREAWQTNEQNDVDDESAVSHEQQTLSSHWGSSSMIQPLRRVPKIEKSDQQALDRKSMATKSRANLQVDQKQKSGSDKTKQKDRHSGKAANWRQQTQSEEPDPIAHVDVYYQTNDDSIDFMVNSLQQKKRESAKAPPDEEYKQSQKRSSNKGLKQQQQPAPYRLHTQESQTQQRHSQHHQFANTTGRNHEIQKSLTMEADSAESSKRGSIHKVPTSATIYINNLMNGVQPPVPDDPQQQPMVTIPSEMLRTQSQVLYPTNQQIFGHVPNLQGYASSNPSVFPQFRGMHPEQQIVFVPVPYLPTPQQQQQAMSAAPSAPAFLQSPQSQIAYQLRPGSHYSVNYQHSPQHNLYNQMPVQNPNHLMVDYSQMATQYQAVVPNIYSSQMPYYGQTMPQQRRHAQTTAHRDRSLGNSLKIAPDKESNKAPTAERLGGSSKQTEGSGRASVKLKQTACSNCGDVKPATGARPAGNRS